MIRYKSILNEGSDEQIIDKSRFIAYASPVATKEEAYAFIGSIKAKHKDAAHNVPAMVIGEKFQIQWASDDGEPQGTSGAPIVQMLVNEGITNVAVVVTRYFGGIKLGTGGLVRAYTSSAKLGILAGIVCHVKDMEVIDIKIDYAYLGKLQNVAGTWGIEIKNILYEEVLTVTMAVDPESKEGVSKNLMNLTSGAIKFLNARLEQVKIPFVE